jgi:predicted nucleotidyltransferase
MIELKPIIDSLVEHEVRFVVIGGVAIIYHGSSHVTQDLDFCYSRDDVNLERIVKALSPFRPRLRGAPEGLPFLFDSETLKRGSNFTFETAVGDVDLLGEVSGVGDYSMVEKNSVEVTMFGLPVKVLTIESLISAKRAAGRTKDLLVLPELEALLELKNEGEI